MKKFGTKKNSKSSNKNTDRNNSKTSRSSDSKSKKSFVNKSLIAFKKDGRRSQFINKKDSNQNKDFRFNENFKRNDRSDKYDREDRIENNDEFILDSLSSFKEYLKYDPNSILEIKCLASYKDKIISLMKENNVLFLQDKIKLQNKEFIEEGSDNSSEIFPLSVKVKVVTFDIDDLISSLKKEDKSVVMACDHITDPRNLGAIIRSAAFLGVSYIIIPEYRQTPITSTVVSTSMGGLSLVKVVSVVNMGMSLEKLKEEGFWIIGTDMDGEDFKDVAGFYEKVVLVLGSEDKGISRLVKEKCDRLVSIPSFSKRKIDSLNVSVAAGILMEAFKR